MSKLAVAALLILAGCSWANVDAVKDSAARASNGYEIAGYQGYSVGDYFGGPYGGAYVWYQLKRVPNNGILYEGALQRWGDEYHIYSLRALDAIEP